MLGLLQLYYLHQADPAAAGLIYQLSRSGRQEFPLSVVSLNITKWTIGAVRAGLLSKDANSRGSLVETAQVRQGQVECGDGLSVVCGLITEPKGSYRTVYRDQPCFVQADDGSRAWVGVAPGIHDSAAPAATCVLSGP